MLRIGGVVGARTMQTLCRLRAKYYASGAEFCGVATSETKYTHIKEKHATKGNIYFHLEDGGGEKKMTGLHDCSCYRLDTSGLSKFEAPAGLIRELPQGTLASLLLSKTKRIQRDPSRSF